MPFFKKKLADPILLVLGLIFVALWAVGKFVATDWLATYYVDIFGAVGFLLLGFLGLSRANQKMEKPTKE